MADEKEIKIVIRAKDEFSGVLERAQSAAEGYGERLSRAYAGVSFAPQAREAELYALALGKVAQAEAARSGPSGGFDGGAGAGEVERARAANHASLVRYNSAVIQEVARSAQSRSEIEAMYTEYSNAQADKRRDFQINAAADTAGAVADSLQNLFLVTGSSHKAMFESMKAFAIAETVIHTYRGASAAYAALAGIPIVGPALGTAAAASAIVAGLARVEQIRSTSPGGGSINSSGRANPAYSGGSSGAGPAPTRLTEDSRPTQNVTIQIYNPLSTQNWSEIVENNIIPAINDAAGRNISVTVRNM